LTPAWPESADKDKISDESPTLLSNLLKVFKRFCHSKLVRQPTLISARPGRIFISENFDFRWFD
jgi:hypothetical protein